MRLVDLSGEIFDGQGGHFPTVVQDFKTIDPATVDNPAARRTFAVKTMTLADHTGTHVDALAHFIPGGATIDAMALDLFWGQAWVADFSAEQGTGKELTLPDLEKLLIKRGITPQKGDVVLFLFAAADGRAVYSGLSGAVAAFLAQKQVKLVGTNQGSIDWSENITRPAHVTLLGAGIPIVEGLHNLDKVAREKFIFCGLPLRVRGGTGSPIRAVAMLQA